MRERFEVVSRPGAAITVTRINLTPEEEADLTINCRLPDSLATRQQERNATLRNEHNPMSDKTAQRIVMSLMIFAMAIVAGIFVTFCYYALFKTL